MAVPKFSQKEFKRLKILFSLWRSCHRAISHKLFASLGELRSMVGLLSPKQLTWVRFLQLPPSVRRSEPSAWQGPPRFAKETFVTT